MIEADATARDLRLNGLFIYPIKSLRGIALQTGVVEAAGLRYDRRWMLVNDDGRFLTQRQLPRMATIAVTVGPEGLTCHTPYADPLLVPAITEQISPVAVTIWRDTVLAHRVSAAADTWFSAALDHSCHLVQLPEATRRAVNPSFGEPGDHVSFADGYPYLIVGQASLDALNRRMETPLPMNRFRPNIVITGTTPFAEDGWAQIQIGTIVFDVVKPCARCPIPQVDQDRGERINHEPLRTLATFRKYGSKVFFAQNAIARGAGTVAVGDLITILATRAPNPPIPRVLA